jgi:hypothetical protein
VGNERRDDAADRRRADVYSSARIGAAAALTLVLVVLLALDVAVPDYDLADLRARSGLTTEQLIYRGRAEGWLLVPGLEATWRQDSLGGGLWQPAADAAQTS